MSRLRTLSRSERMAAEGRDLRAYLFARGLLAAGRRLSAIQKAKTLKGSASGLSIHSPIEKESSNELREF